MKNIITLFLFFMLTYNMSAQSLQVNTGGFITNNSNENLSSGYIIETSFNKYFNKIEDNDWASVLKGSVGLLDNMESTDAFSYKDYYAGLGFYISNEYDVEAGIQSGYLSTSEAFYIAADVTILPMQKVFSERLKMGLNGKLGSILVPGRTLNTGFITVGISMSYKL